VASLVARRSFPPLLFAVVMVSPWKLWDRPQRTKSESRLLRYGVAIVLPMLAVLLVLTRTVFTDTPYLIFLGAVVLSAANGGLAAGFLTTALSALFIKLFFVRPLLSLPFQDWAGMERMLGFVLISLLLCSFVASIRRERNHLRDSEERYRLLAESASDAIVVIDEHGEILYVNPVAERTFGNRSEELLGKDLNELLPGDGYRAQLSEIQQDVDSRKRPVAVQLPGLHQSGEHLLIEMTLGSSSHRGRNVFTAIIRNITGHRHA
jgi:PAS domain S-box-containing protein